jgi:hypothetical protein
MFSFLLESREVPRRTNMNKLSVKTPPGGCRWDIMSQSQRRTFVENVYQTPFAFYTLPKPDVPCKPCLLKNNAPKPAPNMP